MIILSKQPDPFLDHHLRLIEQAPPYLGPRPTGIVGLGGPAGVGKDTAGEIIAAYMLRFGTVYVTSFAEPLYAAVSALTGIPIETLKDRKLKEKPIDWPGAPRGMEGWTIRRLLQWFGTEVVRYQLGHDFWVHRLLERVAARTPNIVIITDVRFENETRICDLTVEIERTGFTYPNDHASSRRMPLMSTVNVDQPDYVKMARDIADALPA